jgi:hypothetical protein
MKLLNSSCAAREIKIKNAHRERERRREQTPQIGIVLEAEVRDNAENGFLMDGKKCNRITCMARKKRSVDSENAQ